MTPRNMIRSDTTRTPRGGTLLRRHVSGQRRHRRPSRSRRLSERQGRRRPDRGIHGAGHPPGAERRPGLRHTEAFSFQVATDTQEETDRYWNAIVGNGGAESACGWCKDRWGLSWQITPRALTAALAAGGYEAKRAFAAMMTMGKIDIAAIDAARRG
ncbi:MAG: VOC family protein [Vicinamibacterales bacterium]